MTLTPGRSRIVTESGGLELALRSTLRHLVQLTCPLAFENLIFTHLVNIGLKRSLMRCKNRWSLDDINIFIYTKNYISVLYKYRYNGINM